MRVAADSLAKAGVMRSARMFSVYASLARRDRGIKAGTYVLRRNSGWSAVLDALRGGKGLVHVVTIPEGFSLSQIAPLLAAKLGQPVDSVDAAARDTALLHQLDVPTPTLEGYLFPDTYIFPRARRRAPPSRRWCGGSSRSGSPRGPSASTRCTSRATT